MSGEPPRHSICPLASWLNSSGRAIRPGPPRYCGIAQTRYSSVRCAGPLLKALLGRARRGARNVGDTTIDWARNRVMVLDLLDRLCCHHDYRKRLDHWRLIERPGETGLCPPPHRARHELERPWCAGWSSAVTRVVERSRQLGELRARCGPTLIGHLPSADWATSPSGMISPASSSACSSASRRSTSGSTPWIRRGRSRRVDHAIQHWLATTPGHPPSGTARCRAEPPTSGRSAVDHDAFDLDFVRSRVHLLFDYAPSR